MLYRLSVTSIFFISCILLLSSCNQSRRIKVRPSLSENACFGSVSCAEAKKIVGTFSNKFTKKNQKNLLTSQQLRDLRDVARNKEAKLSDIAVPLNAEPINIFFDDTTKQKNNTTILGYRTHMLPENIFAFYRQEMERLGWKNVVVFEGIELLLNFQKPGKYCSVSIRGDAFEHNSANTIIIFISS